jgi:hypothetical protein
VVGCASVSAHKECGSLQARVLEGIQSWQAQSVEPLMIAWMMQLAFSKVNVSAMSELFLEVVGQKK